ncbi:hypothetical protein [Burkholderia contaminans]|uniref:hypothetical protein n=1 Tax=Burkholderia contaminans TaxID=488447 RepID=UPI00158B05CF|nr:hypothetical protein [Burkholderia contaminans]
MLIREQGRKLKLLRGERDATSGRSRHVEIGLFNPSRYVLDQLLEALEPHERRALTRWLAAYQESRARTKTKHVLVRSPLQLAALVTVLDVAADADAPGRNRSRLPTRSNVAAIRVLNRHSDRRLQHPGG